MGKSRVTEHLLHHLCSEFELHCEPLSRSEIFALKWKDVDSEAKQIHVTRSIVQNVVGICTKLGDFASSPRGLKLSMRINFASSSAVGS
jgi:hypothetical protein